MSVIEILKHFLRVDSVQDLKVSNLNDSNLAAVNRFFRGKKVEYQTEAPDGNISYHRFRVIAIKPIRADEYSFSSHGGPAQTVADYFRVVKNTKLKHPNLPVVHVGSPNMTNYVPVEVSS